MINHPRLQEIRDDIGDPMTGTVMLEKGDAALLLSIIERQAEALAFYAPSEVWEYGTCGDEGCYVCCPAPIHKDEGKTAREAQADVQKMLPSVEGLDEGENDG